MINLNDTTPVVTANGKKLVVWQKDASGNVSAEYDTVATKTSVGSVAGVITIDASLGNSFRITLTENVTSIVVNNATDAQEITLLWIQNATGTWTVTFPSSIKGGTAPSTTANSVSCQKFTYDITNAAWYATSAGSTGM